MGTCMGKDGNTITSDNLDPGGRFISSKELPNKQLNNNDGQPSSSSSTAATTRALLLQEKLSPPRVPVICKCSEVAALELIINIPVILGGPGSGKITHCDRVVQERQGLAHINMTDLIQQHVVGNGLPDFSLIPPTNLIEVLQMEVKLAVNARAYLISGYPRSMRDVVEYQNKMQRVDRVILLNWHIRILEKQIEFGSQLGDTVLQLARMELKNYSKNVLAVAEYYDQLDKLTVVDGERQPSEVYSDFLATIDAVLQKIPQTAAAPNHTPTGNTEQHAPPLQNGTMLSGRGGGGVANKTNTELNVIWVIGGPGSNKGLLSSTSVRLNFPTWEYLSLGAALRERGLGGNGDLAPDDLVLSIISEKIGGSRKRCWVIDGFPRDGRQVEMFEGKWGAQCAVPPPCILVDCSEVELGRSLGKRGTLEGDREDDKSGAALKRRLELYRTVTLPTLKTLDDQHRLHIIDGDQEDKGRIVEEFNAILGSLVEAVEMKRVGGTTKKKKKGGKRKPSTDTITTMYNEVNGMQNSD